jgi:hypothetical protein
MGLEGIASKRLGGSRYRSGRSLANPRRFDHVGSARGQFGIYAIDTVHEHTWLVGFALDLRAISQTAR